MIEFSISTNISITNFCSSANFQKCTHSNCKRLHNLNCCFALHGRLGDNNERQNVELLIRLSVVFQIVLMNCVPNPTPAFDFDCMNARKQNVHSDF